MPAPHDTPNLIRETRTARRLPGDGVLPLRELVAALPPSLPLAIEAPVRETAHLPPVERAPPRPSRAGGTARRRLTHLLGVGPG
jgi:hypothetical protein